MKKGKHNLFEMMSLINKDYRYSLNESESYKHVMNESLNDPYISKLAEHFMAHNKLSGNVSEDVKFLKEFSSMLEDDDFDPFGHLEKNNKIDEKSDCLLSISNGNAKLHHPYFSLPAGYTCPFAKSCKSYVNRDRSAFKSNGLKIKDTGDIRCYAASAELVYPSVQKSRWRNFDLLQKFKGDRAGMVNLIQKSLEHYGSTITLFRIHESGDFYSQEYFDAWLEVAQKNPHTLFYAYTKALEYWVARIDQIPANFKLTASTGGKRDDLIQKYNLKHVIIVNTPEEAQKLGLRIDVDDSLAYKSDANFALLLHGVQSKESGLNPQAIKNQQTLKQYKKN